jgi:hypothetical protein
MNKNKIIYTLSTHLVVCVISIVCTLYYVGWWARESLLLANNQFKGSGMLIARYSNNVDMQRAFGGKNEYREALIAFSNALDEARSQTPNDPILSEDIISTDKMLNYIRLSMLEKEIGNNAEAEKYKAEAISFCQKIPWEDCSYEKLEKITIKLNEKFIFKGSNKKNKNP